MNITIKTTGFAYDVLWPKRHELISFLAKDFTNNGPIPTKEIRIVKLGEGESYKLIVKGTCGSVPNDTKFFNHVHLSLQRRSINQRQYSEIGCQYVTIRGRELNEDELKAMVNLAYLQILEKLYEYEIGYALSCAKSKLVKQLQYDTETNG